MWTTGILCQGNSSLKFVHLVLLILLVLIIMKLILVLKRILLIQQVVNRILSCFLSNHARDALFLPIIGDPILRFGL